MQKRKLCLVFLIFLLVAVALAGEIAHAQDNYDNYTLQYFLTDTANNYIRFEQVISGIVVPNFSDGGQVSVGFNNVTVTGIYIATYGIGSYRNQGSLGFVNIQPQLNVPPALFLGQTYSQNNKVNINDYNYSVNLNFNGFRGSGIVVLNLMAGSFSNQFSSVHLSMGRDVIPAPSPTIATLSEGNPTLVTLSNAQMQTIAATADNDIQIQGKQSAMATVQGAPNVQGICAVTISSGVNNLISNRVGINIDTGR